MLKAIGVLALQGDFREHISLLESHNVPALEVRTKNDLAQCSALIIPGGESTTMALLLSESGLAGGIKARVKKGMPFYGTCAGAILAAKKVAGEKRFRPLGLIDIDVRRNAFGRQADSFEAEVEVKAGSGAVQGPKGAQFVNGIFIRSPVITRCGKKVEVLARLNGRPVLVRQGKVLAGTFHPETDGNFFAHKMLIELM